MLYYLNYISFCRFYCKNNGVLYENDTIQIGVKTECRANLARMALFYGNKTSFPFIVSAWPRLHSRDLDLVGIALVRLPTADNQADRIPDTK